MRKILTKNYTVPRKENPSIIVIHYTANESLDSVINTFQNPNSKASAHYCVDINGDTIQLVDEQNIAWHAGQSSWNGRTGINQYSIGIELVNFGWGIVENGNLTRDNIVSMFVPISPIDGRESTKHFSWSPYCLPQTVSLFCLVQDIMVRNNIGLENVVGHEHVSPALKLDPGPAFRDIWLGFQQHVTIGSKWGNEHSIVASTQSHCNRLGSKLTVDEIWGSKTQQAIVDIFRKFSIPYCLPSIKLDASNCKQVNTLMKAILG